MSDDLLIAAFYEEADELLADVEASLLGLEGSPGRQDRLHAIFRSVHTLKGNSAMLGFDDIARIAHLLEDLLDQLRTGRREASTRVIDTLLYATDVLRTMLAPACRGVATGLEGQGACDDLTTGLRSLIAGEEPPDAPPVRAAARGDGERATIRVSLEKVDRLIALTDALVTTQAAVGDVVNALIPEESASLRAAVVAMERQARELHEALRDLRVVPIGTVFARLPRLVRDVSAALGKSVALEVFGEDTELDRVVVEKLGDPLAHLVRNAVDHGLEPPAARRSLGKPQVGRVRVSASQEGDDIYIEVADDGRGLDPDQLQARARAVGIAGEAPLSGAQVFALIFRPGFSTAETVTALSGRGVGMDVVRRNVEAVGGSLAIRSEKGRGTTFRITLPPAAARPVSPPARLGATRAGRSQVLGMLRRSCFEDPRR